MFNWGRLECEGGGRDSGGISVREGGEAVVVSRC